MSNATNGELGKHDYRGKTSSSSFFKPPPEGWKIASDPLDTLVPRGRHKGKSHREVMQSDPMWFYGYPKHVPFADPPAYLDQVNRVWDDHIRPLIEEVRRANNAELEAMKASRLVSETFVQEALKPRGFVSERSPEADVLDDLTSHGLQRPAENIEASRPAGVRQPSVVQDWLRVEADTYWSSRMVCIHWVNPEARCLRLTSTQVEQLALLLLTKQEEVKRFWERDTWREMLGPLGDQSPEDVF